MAGSPPLVYNPERVEENEKERQTGGGLVEP
jgi:hypothetical protein